MPNFVPYHVTFVLVSMYVTSVFCQQCPGHKDTPPGAFCVCDPGDSYNGWLYACYDENTYQSFFDVKYVVDSVLIFRCGTSEPYRLPAFNQSEFSQIESFVFKSCPLPNSSFSEILPSQNVQLLKIEMKHGNESFTAGLFKELAPKLTSLILSHNEIRTLPEKIFYRFLSLKSLTLSDNFLTTLSGKMFWELPNLVVLELANNHLESLPEDLFEGLYQLEKVYLYKNRLKRLPSGLFRGLVALRVLDLADNNLIILPDNIFMGLSELVHIRLRANSLQKLPREIFNYTENLQDLDISLNKLQEPLPKELLSSLSNLEIVSFHDCNISEVHEDLFSSSPKISHLKLQNNRLTSLPEDLFRNNHKLKEIDFTNNKIDKLPKNLFPNQKSLEKAYFFNNNLSYLPPGLFRQARAVKILILGKNHITNATKEFFRDLPEVEVLDISANNLTHFSLDFNKEIKRIDVSYNQLKEMPSIEWLQHLKIESINMEHNNIESIYIPVLYSTNKRNPTLNFGYNKIRHVDVQDVVFNDGHIKDLPSKDYENYVESHISLYPNPFTCDCHLFDFFDYLHKSSATHKRSVRFTVIQNFTCNEPQDLKGEKVVKLAGNEFQCPLTDVCEHPCRCFFRAEDKVNIMDCSNQSLKHLPEKAPSNTNILYFQGNNLKHASDLNASVWLNLTDMYLDRNQIGSLDNFFIPPKLKILSLKENYLKVIPQSVLNFTKHAEDFQISLSKNPYSCNCSTMYFKKWITEHYQKVPDVKNVLCFETMSDNGTSANMPIVSISDDIMCPINDWPYRLQLISVTTMCVILALLLFIVSVLYYRNKQTVIAYVYIHLHNVFMCFFNEEDIDEDKIFDAFVSYSGTDRDVALALLQELEKTEPYFKLCIHERNWLPGNLISWNIINSVQNSRRTILVISKEFLSSMWFQVEFHAAYYQMLEDKIDRLIVIVKGDLPPKESMDKDLQHLLSTKTYLVWGEKWFWEKLKYAMPHKKHVIINGDVMALKDKPDTDKVKCVENQIAMLSSVGKTGNKKVYNSTHNSTNHALNSVIIQDPTNNNKAS